MARWTICLLVVAVVWSTVGGLSLDPKDYDLIDGASASSERLRQGTALAEYMLKDETCTAECNNETYSADTDCEGSFMMRCSGSNETAEYNVTYVSDIECEGQWSESGWNESELAAEGEVVCNGAFHEKTIIMVTVDDKTYFVVEKYGCAFMFSYETTSMGGSMIESTTCHGASGYDAVQSGKEDIKDVSKVFLEELLYDVSAKFGNSDFALHPDARFHPSLSSPPMKPVFSVRCNGQEVPITRPCHGALEIAIEVRNISIAEECRGWWIPAPGRVAVFACTGAWTMGVSTNDGENKSEMDASCVGHAMLSSFHFEVHGHHFRGVRSLCIGREDYSSQTQGMKAILDLKPMIEKTDADVYIS